jgi:hypothetical protein
LSQLPDGQGPLWGVQRTTPPHEPMPLPTYAPPTRQRTLLPLYVAIAAVLVIGGVLTVAIVRYTGTTAGTATATTVVEEPTAIVPALPPSSPEWTPPPVTTTTTPAEEPTGYRTVTGPAGVYVSIPADWTVKQGAVPSNLQADSPAGDRLIRFGGSESTSMPLLDTVASNETDNPNIANGYQRLELSPVTTLPVEAVDWEFLWVKDGVPRHGYGRYWRTNGIDYVVYASATADVWSSMAEIVDVMVRTAGPI